MCKPTTWPQSKAILLTRVHIRHGVHQSTCEAHHRDSAIAVGNHLHSRRQWACVVWMWQVHCAALRAPLQRLCANPCSSWRAALLSRWQQVLVNLTSRPRFKRAERRKAGTSRHSIGSAVSACRTRDMLGARAIVVRADMGEARASRHSCSYLGQPAGFKHAGHQHDICSCVDQVGQGLAVHDEHPDVRAVFEVVLRQVPADRSQDSREPLDTLASMSKALCLCPQHLPGVACLPA